MEESKKSNNKRFNEAFCYMPLWAIIMYFMIEDKDKTESLKKHMKYGFLIFIAYLIVNFIFWWLASWLIFVIYLILASVLAYKVYSGEDVNIQVIDDFEKKI